MSKRAVGTGGAWGNPDESIFADLRALREDFAEIVAMLPDFSQASLKHKATAQRNAEKVKEYGDKLRMTTKVAELHLRGSITRFIETRSKPLWQRDREVATKARQRFLLTTLGQGAFDPRGHFVYILWGKDEVRPLYVGESTNVLSRLGSHTGNRERRPHIRNVVTFRCRTASERHSTETALIREFRPPWNIVGIPGEEPRPEGSRLRRLRTRRVPEEVTESEEEKQSRIRRMLEEGIANGWAEMNAGDDTAESA